MNRKSKILKHLDLRGKGIEIGPSHQPVAPKKEGYNVQIIDHLGQQELINKYRAHGTNTSNIEEVDFVWKGESYEKLVGKKKCYDWIIASHVAEHTPDLIGFLNDCDSLLKDTGVLSLVLPDKRYCFDHFRPITSISKLIDNHHQKATRHSQGVVAEYFLNVVKRSDRIAWDDCTGGAFQFSHSLQSSLDAIREYNDDDEYLDVHSWCFVPHSFRLIIHDLHLLGLIPFKEIGFYQTDGFEFFITLGRSGRGVSQTRLEMLKVIDSEMRDGCVERPTLKMFLLKIKRIIQRLAG